MGHTHTHMNTMKDLLTRAIAQGSREMKGINEEDVLKLSGGGDWHTAYLLLYAHRKLPKVRRDLPFT